MTWGDGVAVRGTQLDDGYAETIRFRQTPFQSAQPMLAIFAVIFVFFGSESLSDPVTRQMLLGPIWFMPCTGATIGLIVSRGFGVTLTPDALVSHGMRRRVLPWSEITGITKDNLLGTRRVVVHLRDGRTVRLRAPIGGFPWDPDFERKFHTIGQWWLARRAMTVTG